MFFSRLVFIAFKEVCLSRYTLSGKPVKRTGFQSASVSSADSTAATSTKSASSNGKVASNGQVANGKDGNVDGNGNKVDGNQKPKCPEGWAMSWDESCQRYYWQTDESCVSKGLGVPVFWNPFESHTFREFGETFRNLPLYQHHSASNSSSIFSACAALSHQLLKDHSRFSQVFQVATLIVAYLFNPFHRTF